MDPQSKVHLENAGLSEHNKIQNLPNNPPSDGKNSEPRIPIDLVYCLRRGWRTTSRRGKPGKSIVLFQGSPEAAPVNNSVPPTKKRNREEEPVEDDGKRRIPSKKKLIIMEPGASSSSGRPIPQNGGERAPESSRSAKGKAPAEMPTKQYFCSNCCRKFDSYFALGGHRAYHVRETRKWWGHQPSWAAVWYGQQGVQPNYQETVHVQHEQHGCPWCNRSFTTARVCRRTAGSAA
ncbi:UNVERIFIED_CONTAM: hypothetical protein Sradi_7051800 [Sesamum radiatum]|uniref:C2H2-type domain-containing protein n=1 Tax=Sesamum radiatum TaxID=300843 RepID=A0AAW2J9X7_SESRA